MVPCSSACFSAEKGFFLRVTTEGAAAADGASTNCKVQTGAVAVGGGQKRCVCRDRRRRRVFHEGGGDSWCSRGGEGGSGFVAGGSLQPRQRIWPTSVQLHLSRSRCVLRHTHGKKHPKTSFPEGHACTHARQEGLCCSESPPLSLKKVPGEESQGSRRSPGRQRADSREKKTAAGARTRWGVSAKERSQLPRRQDKRFSRGVAAGIVRLQRRCRTAPPNWWGCRC